MSGVVVTGDTEDGKMWFGGLDMLDSWFPGAWSLDERDAYIYNERHAAAVRAYQDKLESAREERHYHNIRIEPTDAEKRSKSVVQRKLRIRRQPVDPRCDPHNRIYYDVIVNGECVSFVVCPLTGTTWVEIEAANAQVAYAQAGVEEQYTATAGEFTRLTGFWTPTSFERAFAKAAHLSIHELARIRHQRHAIAARRNHLIFSLEGASHVGFANMTLH